MPLPGERESRNLENTEFKVKDLLSREVFSDWNKIKPIIEKTYTEITSLSLDYDVRLISESAFHQEIISKGVGTTASAGIAYENSAMVALPEIELEEEDEDLKRDKVLDFYTLLFHELGHLSLTRRERDEFERYLFDYGVVSSYETAPSEIAWFFDIAKILDIEKAEILEDAWIFMRMIDESRAQAFAFHMGTEVWESEPKLKNEFINHARKSLISAAGLAIISDRFIIRDLNLITLLDRHKGDIKETFEAFQQLDRVEAAQMVLERIKGGKVLPLLQRVSSAIAEKYKLPKEEVLLTQEEKKALHKIGTKNHAFTKVLQRVSSSQFPDSYEEAKALINEANMSLIKAVKEGNEETILGLLKSSAYLQKDKLIFYLADKLEKEHSELSRILFKQVLEQYPNSEWRYKAQHRIKGV